MSDMPSRREFLQAAAASAVLYLPARAKQLTTVGVQLYTVRSILPEKPAETLRAIEAIGYREIEATYAGLERIWPAVQATSLKPVSIHLDSTVVTRAPVDDLARALDKVKQWGFSYAVFPYLPPAERGGLDEMRALADRLNTAGERCQKLGLKFCYHNHAFEFEPEGDSSRFQVLVDRLDPKLVGFELDVFWVSVAGKDPAELLRRLSGRVPLLHLKDKASEQPLLYKETVPKTAFKEVGSGALKWPEVLRAASAAGVSHYFVEQDQTPGDPVESLRQSFAFVSKLQF